MLRCCRYFSLSRVLLILPLLALLTLAPRESVAQAGQEPLIVGYFPQWGIDDQPQYLVKTLVNNGSAKMLDQINYSQGAVSAGHCSIAYPKADLNYTFDEENSVDGTSDVDGSFRGNFHQLEELKQRNPKLKVLISLEGNAASFAEDAQPQNRYVFVASCVDMFLRGRFAPGIVKPGIFDGIDVDWETPTQEDAANFIALLAEFRRQMDLYKPGLRLSVAVGSGPSIYPGVDMAEVSRLADQVAVMNYDYAGPWSKTTGILAPLYPDKADPTDPGSVDTTISAYKQAGVPAQKLLMGLPFYGYGWEEVEETNHGLYQTGRSIHSDKPYHFVQELVEDSTLYRDARTQAPWIFDGDTFWTFDDATSIRFKTNYAQQQQLGGVMIWELSGDMPDASLLTATYQELRQKDTHPGVPEPEQSDE
jgi:chitinase